MYILERKKSVFDQFDDPLLDRDHLRLFDRLLDLDMLRL